MAETEKQTSYNRKLILSVCGLLILTACKKDTNSQTTGIPKLAQTVWKGNLILNEERSRFASEINVEFRTETAGYFVLSNASETLIKLYHQDSPFTYKREIKNLFIDQGSRNILLGNWIAIKSTTNEIILVKEITNYSNADTLIINRVN